MVKLRRKFMTSSKTTFEEHFDFFAEKITNNINFTFARYADGERMILCNTNILNGTQAYEVDKWKYDNNITFSNDLLQTCEHIEDQYYYAISCKCCDPHGLVYYKNLLKTDKITFSNLFINANYKKFINFISSIERSVFLIANENCLNSVYPFKVEDKMPIPNDCVNWYEENKEEIISNISKIAKKYKNQLFLISAGPLSEILIHNLYINNPENTYVDVGSSLDIFTHNKITRPYQLVDNPYNSRSCTL